MVNSLYYWCVLLLPSGSNMGVFHSWRIQICSWPWFSPRNISLCMVFPLAADGANDNYNQFVQFAILHFSPNSFSSRGSYFNLGGEGLQILWIRCVGGCHTGCRWRCCVVCVGVGFADVRPGCHTGCRWRCRVVGVGVRVRRFKTGLSQCGFADPGPGCRTGCRWRCSLLMCVGVRGLQI